MTRKKWVKPELKVIDLSGEERATLISADDPTAELVKMIPQLAGKKAGPV